MRIGIGGPVGSGKTTLVGALCVLLRDELSLAVVTNDIFTTEDAEALRRAAVLPTERIVAVETGCCPHTAIRDDIAANLDAAETLEAALGDVDLTLIESGGDNLTAIFSRGLVDAQIFVLDTAGGDDVPRKGGPGVATADLLVINKVDLAPHVGADVDRMLADAARTARRGRWCRRRCVTRTARPRSPTGCAAVVAAWSVAAAVVRAAARDRGRPSRRAGRARRRPLGAADGHPSDRRPRARRRERGRARRWRRAGARRGGRRRRPPRRWGPSRRRWCGPAPAGWSSQQTVHADVGRDGRLWWQPEPLVAVAGCRHRAIDDGAAGRRRDAVDRRRGRRSAAPARRRATSRWRGVSSATAARSSTTPNASAQVPRGGGAPSPPAATATSLAAVAVGTPAPDVAPIVSPAVALAVLPVAADAWVVLAAGAVAAGGAPGAGDRPAGLTQAGGHPDRQPRGWCR